MDAEYGYKAVYWVGYNEDFSRDLVAKYLPGAIYQPYFHAWKGVFDDEVEKRARSSYIDVDFLNQYAKEEMLALKMMDRMDFDKYSFNFMERQQFFRNLVRKWKACIDYLKPAIVITPMVPHRVYDYTLYLLCRFLNIPFIIFNHTSFPGRYMVLNDIKSIGEQFIKDYKFYTHSNEHSIIIPEDIKDRYNTIKRSYSEGVPTFMATHALNDRKSRSFLKLISKFISDRKEDVGGQNMVNSLLNGIYCYGKRRNETIEESSFSLLYYSYLKMKNNRYKKALLSYYRKLTVNPDFSKRYILFGLHYQPEATTSPSGDVFVDQRLCIDLILKNTPADVKLYVKEHPNQFLSHLEGHTSRLQSFYADLATNSRICLIDINQPTLPLIQNSIAVATIVGTIGWESMIYQKPLLQFGNSWYENCPLILSVKDETSAKQIMDYIDSYKFDEFILKSYLASVGKNTYQAYYYKGRYKDLLNITEEKCIDEIIKSIFDHI